MTLRKFNNYLSILVVLLGLYIAVSPFIPQISYAFRDKSPEASSPYSGQLSEIVGSESSTPAPEEPRIVIPSIGLDEPIYSGDNIGVINDGGTWLLPNSTDFDVDSNSVVVGHRFFGNNVSTFYHLDKVEPGQYIAVYWRGEERIYQVDKKMIVPADAIEIEAPTTSHQLTLYTCDPIWTAKNRLVVIAKPLEPAQ